MRPAISSTSSAALECKKAACHFCPAGRLLIGCAAAIVDRRASDDLASVAFTVATCHGRPKSQNENSGRRNKSNDGSRDEQLNEKVPHHGTLPRSACTNTKPTRMIGYRICQIKPMVAGAGVQPGFARLSYHSIQDITFPISTSPCQG